MLKALVVAAVLNVCSGHSEPEETAAVQSLNEVKNLQILGDVITIASKNLTGNGTNCNDLDEYLQSHVIRIKAPFVQDKYFNFELSNFVPDALAEGRKKRISGLRDILVPLLLAIKHKLTVAAILMMFTTALALKGLWAGVTGMFISKLVALKVFLQSQEKSDDGQQDDHDGHGADSSEQNAEDDHEDNEEPIVIYLHSDKHGGKFSRRREGRPFTRYVRHNPKNWKPWKRR